MTQDQYEAEQAWIADNRLERLEEFISDGFLAQEIYDHLNNGYDVICSRSVNGKALEPFLITCLHGKALEIAPALGTPVIVLCIDTGEAHYFN